MISHRGGIQLLNIEEIVYGLPSVRIALKCSHILIACI